MKYKCRKIDEDFCPSVEQKETPIGQLYVNFANLPEGIEPLKTRYYQNVIQKGNFKKIAEYYKPEIFSVSPIAHKGIIKSILGE